MQDSFRRSTITIPLPAPPAAANGVATYVAPRMMRIASAQLCLSDTGTGAGATNVNLKVNGNAINAANSLSIAGAASGKSLSTEIIDDSNFPGGFRLNSGDTVTVDVTSVPATTVPKAAFIVLDMVQVDA
ncbi:MAG TPA: hypothetical protein VHX37_13505 [Acidobacteriaceae bacterium]|jgi:hypothetical protein|nr:hypothetical protein [Acidobacteriaceae bacterium]